MNKLVFIVCLAMSANVAIAQETWVGTTVASKHLGTDREYNEEHWPSIFIEQHFDGPWSYQAGVYKNSYKRNTWYVLAGYELVRMRFLGQEVALGAAAGLGTGYTEDSAGNPRSGLSPMLGLVLEWRPSKFTGFNTFANTAVVAAQPKARVR